MQNNQLPTKTLAEFTDDSIKEGRMQGGTLHEHDDNNTMTRSKSHIKILATVMNKPTCPWHRGYTHC